MRNHRCVLVLGFVALAGCGSDNGATVAPADSGALDAPGSGPDGGPSVDASAKNPDSATLVSIDRFSDTAGMLFKRSANSALPGPNAPIDCDTGPFVTRGLGPNGEHATYYNFDVQPTAPAPIYVFFSEGSTAEFPGQLHVVDVIPGQAGYNDFWQVTKVTVPASYVANTVTSLADISAAGYLVTPTNMLVNCPVVPDGSTAALRYGRSESPDLITGWYRGQLVKYFSFQEASSPFTTSSSGLVPFQPIYVSFNINPGNPRGGPPSGFMTELGSTQTHNVIAALPPSPTYSPLWQVVAYDNAAFGAVHDLATAASATVLVPNAGYVNCPVVAVAAEADGGIDAGGD